MFAKSIIMTVATALTLATGGMAQTSFDMLKTSKGEITRWTSSYGNFSVKHLGQKGDLFRFRFKRDGSKGHPLSLLSWSNRNGDTVKVKIGSSTITFSPHDCSLTVGRCEYVETHSKLGSKKMVWNAKKVDGVWNYTKHESKISKATLVQVGTFTIDELGYVIDRDFQTYKNGRLLEKHWTRRVR